MKPLLMSHRKSDSQIVAKKRSNKLSYHTGRVFGANDKEEMFQSRLAETQSMDNLFSNLERLGEAVKQYKFIHRFHF
jgi:hypothetical protein